MSGGDAIGRQFRLADLFRAIAPLWKSWKRRFPQYSISCSGTLARARAKAKARARARARERRVQASRRGSLERSVEARCMGRWARSVAAVCSASLATLTAARRGRLPRVGDRRHDLQSPSLLKSTTPPAVADPHSVRSTAALCYRSRPDPILPLSVTDSGPTRRLAAAPSVRSASRPRLPASALHHPTLPAGSWRQESHVPAGGG